MSDHDYLPAKEYSSWTDDPESAAAAARAGYDVYGPAPWEPDTVGYVINTYRVDNEERVRANEVLREMSEDRDNRARYRHGYED